MGINYKNWTSIEDDFLIRCYDGSNMREVAQEFEDRTFIAVKGRIAKLKKDKLIMMMKDKNMDVPDNKRRCSSCNKILDLSAFSTVSKKCNFHECKECNNDRKRNFQIAKKEAIYREKFKLEHGAIDDIIKEKKTNVYICPKCGEERPGTDYYYLKSNGMRSGYCKKCECKRKNDNR